LAQKVCLSPVSAIVTDYGRNPVVQIAPSILAADFARLADEVAHVKSAGASLLHVDVMDGHFVPNLTIGPPVVKALHAVTDLPLDVHLMVEEPDESLPTFIDSGSAILSVPVEACRHLHRTIQTMKAAGVKAPVVLNPASPVSLLHDILLISTARQIREAGADIFVAGTAVCGQDDYAQAISALQN
jgi:pentose-5-phosphate-3-epimerase